MEKEQLIKMLEDEYKHYREAARTYHGEKMKAWCDGNADMAEKIYKLLKGE